LKEPPTSSETPKNNPHPKEKTTMKKTKLKTTPAATSKKTASEIITEAIIAKLESGVIPWKKTWNGSTQAPRNFITNKPYRGINAFLLANTEFASPHFLTFKQIQEKKAVLKAGAKSFPVVFWSMVKVEDGETCNEINIPIMRYFRVFNIEQTNLPVPAITETPLDFEPLVEAERIIANMPMAPEIRQGQAKAFYSPSLDYVNMPKSELFESAELYYSILFHELGHSTGHSSRLARKGVTESSYFGSHEYSKEELIAEMTACFICGEIGITPATLDNSAAYIQSWLRALKSKDNKNLVITAASAAQKAFDYIMDRKPAEYALAA
jgi:antirestriction protein ArdC